ncbi:MAG: response regulator [Spirochaetota bacterium]
MLTVLIIDDEWSIREVTTLMLERAGFKALSAASAAEGLDVLAGNDVSLVIIDVVLPERNGLDLALEVHQRKPKLPIILMSGRISTEADSIKNFTGHFGIACSIAKPFTQAQLIQVIKNSLASSC